MVLTLPSLNEPRLFRQTDVRETPVSAAQAPTTATYLTVTANTDLTNERTIVAGEGIDFTDLGANSTFTINGENATTTNKGVIELATEDEVQTGTNTTKAVVSDTLQSVLSPIGSVVAWLKSYANTPQTLPTGWVECDGAVLSDADSVYNGQTLPDLNGGNRFLRGNSTSGGTGGGETMAHTHTGPSHTHGLSNAYAEIEVDSAGNWIKTSYNAGSFTTARTITGVSVATGGTAGANATGLGGDTNSSGTGSTGGASNTENRPPFYDMVWIMRVK